MTSPVFAGRRYAVLGLARSGLAAAATLLASGAHVLAWDAREEPRLALARLAQSDRLAQSNSVAPADRLTLADPVTADLAGFAGIVVSPGVPLNRHPIVAAAARAGVPVIGDIELFAQARASLPPHRVVGITGTNGKSTTTALVCHLLRSAGRGARMAGNIGVPILAEEPLRPNANGVGVYVIELSSYQIDLTHSLDCEVAALLNLTPDHLDRYAGFEAYVAAKLRLFAMQSPGGVAVFGGGDAPTLHAAAALARERPGRVYAPDPASLTGQQHWPSLQGPHNLENAVIAATIAMVLGVDAASVASGLASFVGLPHRMERVAQADGVLFVNDSKATNPASTAPALAAFAPVDDADGPRPRIHWICGGLPKSDTLDECEPYFANVVAAYVIGEAGPRFAELLAPYMPVHRSEMMCEAIRQAIADAQPGDVILLSPACASFDQYRDYEARGDTFRGLVERFLAHDGDPCAARRAAG